MLKKMKRRFTFLLAALVATFGLSAQSFLSTASAAELNYGKVGEPIDLVVGYQPYYTEAWSGVVMKGLVV